MTELEDVQPKSVRILGLSLRAWCAWILGVLLVACGVAVRVAPMNTQIRLLLATTLIFAILTCLVFLMSVIGRRPGFIFPSIFIAALFVVWAILGTKVADENALRNAYERRLRAYIGSPYLWRGEADMGIDASGLARASLWQAMVREGIKQVNPRLLGPHLWKFWWRDIGAKEIAEGRYGYTRVIGRARKLAGYDTTELEVGDIAISKNQHVMVYYGDGLWIEASPIDRRVVVNPAPADSKRRWFNEPVTLARWWLFTIK